VLPGGKDLDRFAQTVLRNAATLLVADGEATGAARSGTADSPSGSPRPTSNATSDVGGGGDDTDSVGAARSGSVGVASGVTDSFTPEELRKVPHAKLVEVMGRLRDKVITIPEAVSELRDAIDDDGTLDSIK
jgi:hypothetical protein